MSADISVIITSHNERPFIPEALDSVLEQTRSDRISRIIAVDDRSSDGSRAWWEAQSTRAPNLDLAFVEAFGPAAARNAGLARVETEYVAFLDGDDFWARDKLEHQVATLAASNADIVYGDFVDFTDAPHAGVRICVRQFHVRTRDLARKYFLWDGPVLPSTVLMRTAVARSTGGFAPELKLFEETDFFWRAAHSGARFQHCRASLSYKRRRQGSLSHDFGKWIAAADLLAERSVAIAPGLAADVGRRRGFRLAKVAEAHFRGGDPAQGWRTLRAALRLNPYNPRAYLYALSALAPETARETLKRRARSLRALLAGSGE